MVIINDLMFEMPSDIYEKWANVVEISKVLGYKVEEFKSPLKGRSSFFDPRGFEYVVFSDSHLVGFRVDDFVLAEMYAFKPRHKGSRDWALYAADRDFDSVLDYLLEEL